MHERDLNDETIDIFAGTEQTREVDVEYVRAANKLIEQTVEIIPLLNSEREPEIAKYEFFFHSDRLHDLQLPQLIADSLLTREVTGVSVLTASSIHHPISPVLTMNVYTRENDSDTTQTPTVTVSINPNSGEDGNGYFYDETTDRETAISIPQTQLRQSIASLIFPIYDGNYGDFAELDLLDEEVFPNLNNALRKHANESNTEARYEFSHNEGLDGWIFYTQDDAKLTSVELYDIRKRQQGVTQKQTLIDDEAGMQVQMLFDEQSLGMAFYECRGPVGAENIPTPYAPEIQDIKDMHEYVAALAAKIKAKQLTQTIPFEEHHSTSADSYSE